MAELVLDVACGTATHHLRLVDGRVRLDDHADVDAERALVAFGGAPPACLELLELWEDAVSDGGFLAEWAGVERIPRSRISWLHAALERTRSEGLREFLWWMPEARAARMGRFLVTFPGPWLDRAAVEVAGRLASGEGAFSEHVEGFLAEGAARRLRWAFVRAVARTESGAGPAALVPLKPLVGDGIPARIEGLLKGRDSWAVVMIDVAWLADVWGVGAAVVEGDLVLAVADGWARAVRWVPGGGGLVPVLEDRPLVHDGGRWRFA